MHASLTFLVPSRDKPSILMAVNHAEPNQRSGNLREAPVWIADARELSPAPEIDREGFGLVTEPTRVANFYDADEVRRVYYPEVVEFVKRVTGARAVHVFDHTLRVEDEATRRKYGTRLPVQVVHNDYTEDSAPKRVRDLLGAEAEAFLSRRYAFVNVWRSFGESAERFPLAVADGRSVPSADIIGVDMIYPDRVGEIYYAAHSPGQRWYWFSRMRRDEAMLLKCFDSARDGRMRYTIHTGFANLSAPPGTPPRESIEVRTLLGF